jgi:Glycosyl transferase family 2
VHASTPTPASIVVPTRARPDYLRVALASVAPQAAAAGAEVLVVDDAGPSAAIRGLAERFGARYEPHPAPLGLNVARNTGVERSTGELVVFVDDDVEVAPGWLQALLEAAREHPGVQVFAGPIRARLEGRSPRGCGREAPPITTLDLGPRDTHAVRFAWGANMAVRRAAFARVGPFDVTLEHGGDEQEWQERLTASLGAASGDGPPRRGDRDGKGKGEGEGPILYVAGAALDHRRAGADARLRSLARTAYARGRAARRFDAHRGQVPGISREMATLAGCLGHVVRRRCPAGLTMAAHSLGRVREGAAERRRSTLSTEGNVPSAGDDFLSGASGAVGGRDAVRRELLDRLAGARETATGRGARLARAARRAPPTRSVLVLGVERPEHRALAAAAHAELRRSRHEVQLHTCPPGERGRFENLNALLASHPAAAHDWLLAIDDDVRLPRGFLDRLLFLAERFSLDLAQPAHRLRSHAAWEVTRRRAGAVARETRFVEIGPVTLFSRTTFSALLPFPALRMGWGVDLHWAALARERGWRLGVIDAVAIGHGEAPAASAYPREQAIAEARAFLAAPEHPHLSAAEAQTTLATHRRW